MQAGVEGRSSEEELECRDATLNREQNQWLAGIQD
jgi:ribosome modulation factor